MISVDQIRAKLNAFIEQDRDVDALDEWLTAVSWNMHQDSSPDAVRLVGKIELLLADLEDGRISAENLVRSLRGLSSVVEFSCEVYTGQSSIISTRNYEWSVASDTQPSVGFSYTPPSLV